MITERQILFKPEMVASILKGSKTCTRRLNRLEAVNEYPSRYDLIEIEVKSRKNRLYTSATFLEKNSHAAKAIACPYGKPGDRLWVRETWRPSTTLDKCQAFDYLADLTPEYGDLVLPEVEKGLKWKPSIYMPRKACRLVLEIIEIKAQRLFEITEPEAICEGITKRTDIHDQAWQNYFTNQPEIKAWLDPIGSFASLWMSLNGSNSWTKNYWVWAISFKPVLE